MDTLCIQSLLSASDISFDELFGWSTCTFTISPHEEKKNIQLNKMKVERMEVDSFVHEEDISCVATMCIDYFCWNQHVSTDSPSLYVTHVLQCLKF